jgi:GAF domain-containing protein/anti-sigma regulatory factor (Ser/Thr protein kinase)
MKSKPPTTSVEHDLARKVQRLERQLAEAYQREAATAEVLKVISRSAFDLQTVLDTLAASAARLCDGYLAVIRRRVGDAYPIAGTYGLSHEQREHLERYSTTPDRGSVFGRTIIEGRTVHIPDVFVDPEFNRPQAPGVVGVRAGIGVPLMREGAIIGALTLLRTEPQPFSQKQIELLETFSDQAVIAIENARLFEELQARTRELTESLEDQTATSDVLNVISRFPSDVQPVLEVIVQTARKLCGAERAIVWRLEDAAFRPMAFNGMDAERIRVVAQHRMPVGPESVMGRAVLAGRAVHVPDISADPSLGSAQRALSSSGSIRAVLAVPLVRKGQPIGVITVSRTVVSPFTDRQIDLIETFADQAVIAIENTRLFEEVQARTRELTEALEQKTATSEVLGVISRSKFDLQPVFDTMAENAVKLCHAERAFIFRFDGNLLRAVASYNVGPELRGFVDRNPIAPGQHSVSARAALERRTVHVPDVQSDPQFAYALRDVDLIRTVLAVPLLRGNDLLGTITIYKLEAKPFTEKQVELVETFADQAVIAIENARLFEEVQARTHELQESLEYQTATSDVLSVISRSKFDLQPVLDTIARVASQLCVAEDVVIQLREQFDLRIAAHHGSIPVELNLKRRIGRGWVAGRTVVDREPIHVPDMASAADEFPLGHQLAQRRGYGATLGVPLLRENEAIGCLLLRRVVAKPFTEKQIALLQTFADQAVIAIENTRLFEEVQARTRELTESLEQQTATADVLKVISRSALDLQKVLDALVESAARLCNADDAGIFQVVGDGLRLVAHYGQLPTIGAVGQLTFPHVRGRAVGRAVIDLRTIQVADALAEADEYPENRKSALQLGFRTLLAVPLVHAGEAIGVISIRRAEVRPFTERQIELVNTFADQAVIAIENTRLFEEVQARTRELAKTVEDLEIASQHKNQFVANMSHELRTPLAAILGYAELIQEGFYEPQGPKSLDALTRIRSNGKHLLGLINTVLDIAKIESGQFSLNLGEYALENVVETVRAATEALAETKKLGLKTEVAKQLPIGVGDEQRLTQVLLNLVGNAIKFTDKGVVQISAKVVNRHFAISVTDTGPGIPIEEQKRIFEQFHQVDSSNTKAKGGTGLGLAIAKQIVEMHRGRIWVESSPGEGATFQMELPILVENRKDVA